MHSSQAIFTRTHFILIWNEVKKEPKKERATYFHTHTHSLIHIRTFVCMCVCLLWLLCVKRHFPVVISSKVMLITISLNSYWFTQSKITNCKSYSLFLCLYVCVCECVCVRASVSGLLDLLAPFLLPPLPFTTWFLLTRCHIFCGANSSPSIKPYYLIGLWL